MSGRAAKGPPDTSPASCSGVREAPLEWCQKHPSPVFAGPEPCKASTSLPLRRVMLTRRAQTFPHVLRVQSGVLSRPMTFETSADGCEAFLNVPFSGPSCVS